MSPRRIPLDNRFYRHIQTALTDGGCWLWTGAKDTRGYGQMRIDGKTTYATHIALLLDGRAVPKGMNACHRCDNPACVRPDHLFVGSQKDNVRDMMAKGRANHSGLALGRAPRAIYKPRIFSPEQIELIISSPKGNKLMARELGCSPSGIRGVRVKYDAANMFREETKRVRR